MPSDVKFSLASVLAEFNSLRRAEKTADGKTAEGKTAEGNRPASPEGEGADRPNFDRLVSDQAAHIRAKDAAQQRLIDRGNEKMMPERPAKAREDRVVCGEEPAPRTREARKEARKDEPREDRVTCGDPTAAKKADRVVCGEEGEKKTAAEDAAGEEARTDKECAAGTGLEHTTQPEAVATPVVGEQPVVDAALLPEAVLLQGAQSAEALAMLAAAAETGETPVQTMVPGAASAEVGAVVETEAADAAAKAAAGLVQIAGEAQAKTEIKAAGESEAIAVADAADAAPDLAKALAKTGEPTGQTPTAGTISTGEASGVAQPEAGGKEEVAGKSTAPNLHPARVPQFADFLEGFGGSNAIHRPADILAGLDRSVVASALNRGGEVSRPTPLQMLPIEIGMQAVRGVTNFQIRLDPAELGRVEVRLQIRDNGEVNASLVVDRVETLQMLKRDASTLQYAFEQAGLKQSADGLTFSLRGEGQNGQQQERGQNGRTNEDLDELALQAQIGEAAMRRVLIPNSSIDRMV